jgi:hypothetical protein
MKLFTIKGSCQFLGSGFAIVTLSLALPTQAQVTQDIPFTGVIGSTCTLRSPQPQPNPSRSIEDTKKALLDCPNADTKFDTPQAKPLIVPTTVPVSNQQPVQLTVTAN